MVRVAYTSYNIIYTVLRLLYMGIWGTELTSYMPVVTSETRPSHSDQFPMVEAILVVGSDQPSEDVFLQQVVNALDALARLYLRRRRHAAVSPSVRARDRGLLRYTELGPVLMGNLPVKRDMDHVEDVPKRDRGRYSRAGVSIIVELEVDRPLRDGIVRDAHPCDGRVRRGLVELVGGDYDRLSGTGPEEGGEGWRGEVEVKVGAGCFSVEEGVDLELGRWAGPGGGRFPWSEAPAKGATSTMSWGGWGGKEWARRQSAVPGWSTGTGWRGGPVWVVETHTLRSGGSEIRG